MTSVGGNLQDALFSVGHSVLKDFNSPLIHYGAVAVLGLEMWGG